MSSAVVATGVYDRLSFLGPRVPNEVKVLKALSNVDESTFRGLIKFVVTDIEGGHIIEDDFQSLLSMSVNPDELCAIYAGLLYLLKGALRMPESCLKQEFFREDLKELGIPNNYATDLVSVVYGERRPSISKQTIEQGPHHDRLKDLRWRVDVAISTSSLSRVLEPSVLMELTTTAGKLHTFEVHPQQFHHLRFAVASVLKEMGELEKRSIMKQ